MKTKILIATLSILTTSALAAEVNCSAVKGDKARLACYDKADKESKLNQPVVAPVVAAAPIAPSKPKAEGEVFSSGKWHVVQKLDSMTDKKTCTALYQAGWTIQGTSDSMYVNLGGRGGVKAYQLRIDDEPADSLRLASKMEKQISAVDLDHSFARVYNSKRVRLQISTILRDIVVEDIDTTGFKDAVDYIKSNCGA